MLSFQPVTFCLTQLKLLFFSAQLNRLLLGQKMERSDSTGKILYYAENTTNTLASAVLQQKEWVKFIQYIQYNESFFFLVEKSLVC